MMDGALLEKHFTVRNLSEHVDLTERWIRQRIARGEIKVVRAGRRVLVPQSEALRLLTGGNRERAAAEPTTAAGEVA